MKSLLNITAAALFCWMSVVQAHGYKAGAIEIDHPWSRATVEAVPTGAVYLTLRNSGGTADRLVGVSTPVAKKAELHTHIKDGELVRMRQINAIELAASSSVTLESGGLHIMLIGLKHALIKGKSFPLTLVFEEAGPVVVQVDVQGITDLSPAHGGQSASKHNH
ncbi:hypothetical protein PuT2_13380 [Pusillimonas sp. T2]|uniref:copper chaperone PCu(A)C n=1 Tax=Pusillimonas sp. T2 TaxID=1548123 RepID=UPI000B8E2590|nr:copper chaperone PCu(A)C [Pusillimonas sp. T2]OXR48415.1 hypothetical protein PuT2_13380 [Pusillimonas sp. T2]